MTIVTTNMGLTRWDQPSDLFSYTTLSNNFNLIDQHDHSSGKGTQIPTGGIANLAVTTTKLADSSVATAKIIDANVTNAKLGADAVTNAKVADAAVQGENLGTTLSDQLGVSNTVTRRGALSIATSEQIPKSNSQVPALMPTPDRISNVVLPSGGIIMIWYSALWQYGTLGAAAGATVGATPYLNETAIQTQTRAERDPGGAPGVFTYISETNKANLGQTHSTGVTSAHLFSTAGGLISPSGDVDVSDVTTGQVLGAMAFSGLTALTTTPEIALGGPMCVFADPGTYNVSVRYWYRTGDSSTFTITAKNRHLWVMAIGF